MSDRHTTHPIYRPDQDELAWLKLQAAAKGITVTQVIRNALAAHRLIDDEMLISDHARRWARDGLAEYEDWSHDRGDYADLNKRLSQGAIANPVSASRELLTVAALIDAARRRRQEVLDGAQLDDAAAAGELVDEQAAAAAGLDVEAWKVPTEFPPAALDVQAGQ